MKAETLQITHSSDESETSEYHKFFIPLSIISLQLIPIFFFFFCDNLRNQIKMDLKRLVLPSICQEKIDNSEKKKNTIIEKQIIQIFNKMWSIIGCDFNMKGKNSISLNKSCVTQHFLLLFQEKKQLKITYIPERKCLIYLDRLCGDVSIVLSTVNFFNNAFRSYAMNRHAGCTAYGNLAHSCWILEEPVAYKETNSSQSHFVSDGLTYAYSVNSIFFYLYNRIFLKDVFLPYSTRSSHNKVRTKNEEVTKIIGNCVQKHSKTLASKVSYRQKHPLLTQVIERQFNKKVLRGIHKYVLSKKKKKTTSKARKSRHSSKNSSIVKFSIKQTTLTVSKNSKGRFNIKRCPQCNSAYFPNDHDNIPQVIRPKTKRPPTNCNKDISNGSCILLQNKFFDCILNTVFSTSLHKKESLNDSFVKVKVDVYNLVGTDDEKMCSAPPSSYLIGKINEECLKYEIVSLKTAVAKQTLETMKSYFSKKKSIIELLFKEIEFDTLVQVNDIKIFRSNDTYVIIFLCDFSCEKKLIFIHLTVNQESATSFVFKYAVEQSESKVSRQCKIISVSREQNLHGGLARGSAWSPGSALEEFNVTQHKLVNTASNPLREKMMTYISYYSSFPQQVEKLQKPSAYQKADLISTKVDVLENKFVSSVQSETGYSLPRRSTTNKRVNNMKSDCAMENITKTALKMEVVYTNKPKTRNSFVMERNFFKKRKNLTSLNTQEADKFMEKKAKSGHKFSTKRNLPHFIKRKCFSGRKSLESTNLFQKPIVNTRRDSIVAFVHNTTVSMKNTYLPIQRVAAVSKKNMFFNNGVNDFEFFLLFLNNFYIPFESKKDFCYTLPLSTKAKTKKKKTLVHCSIKRVERLCYGSNKFSMKWIKNELLPLYLSKQRRNEEINVYRFFWGNFFHLSHVVSSGSTEITRKNKTNQLLKKVQQLHEQILAFGGFLCWAAGQMSSCCIVHLNIGKLARETLSKLVVILTLIISQMAKDIHRLLVLYDSGCYVIFKKNFEWSIDQRVKRYRTILYGCEEYQRQLVTELSLLKEFSNLNSNHSPLADFLLRHTFRKPKKLFKLIKLKEVALVKTIKDTKFLPQPRFTDIIHSITQSDLMNVLYNKIRFECPFILQPILIAKWILQQHRVTKLPWYQPFKKENPNVLASLVSSSLQKNKLIRTYSLIVLRKSDAIVCTMNCFFNLQAKSSQYNPTIKKPSNAFLQLPKCRKQFNIENLFFFHYKAPLAKRVTYGYSKEQISYFLLYLYSLSDPKVVKQGFAENLFKLDDFFMPLLFQNLVRKKPEVKMVSRESQHPKKTVVKKELLHCTRVDVGSQNILDNTDIVQKQTIVTVSPSQKRPSFNRSFKNIVKEQTLNTLVDKILLTVLEKPIEPFTMVLKEYRNIMCQFSQTSYKDAEEFNKSYGQILHEVVMASRKFKDTTRFNKKLWKSFCSPQGGGSEAYLKMCSTKSKLARKLVEKMTHVKMTCQNGDLVELVSQFLDVNQLGPVVFITAELEHWSSVGGLGVMVNNLTRTLTKSYHQNIYVITPWYQRDSHGRHDEEHCGKNIKFHSKFNVLVAGEMIQIDLYEASHDNVNILLLRNRKYFYSVYQKSDVSDSLRYLVVTAKASLEALCQRNLIPSLLITNDWPSGLVPAYGKNSYFFGNVFENTTFFHLIHNLGTHYEGRIYADGHSVNEYAWITELSTELLVDPFWDHVIFNPSRCCLLCCDTWGTVSPSYAHELQYSGNSPLAPLLTRYSKPFAYPNGADKEKSIQMLKRISVETHDQAKAIIQKKYFNLEKPNLSIPLFAFIGRITKQKGIDLIVDSVEHLILLNDRKVHFLIAGKADKTDEHAVYVVQKMQRIRMMYPSCFWANPDDFFTDGSLINLGADLALMPSQFEPGGIVQHEFFIAGTPVLAFSTGGLKDTVFEFDGNTLQGNGFLFHDFSNEDFIATVIRAQTILRSPSLCKVLRDNASYSLVTCEQMSKGWLHEFYRLKGKLCIY